MTAVKAKNSKASKSKQQAVKAAEIEKVEAIPAPTPAPSKQAQVIVLLKTGASIAAIQEMTGWQPHSIRGFISGTVRKKLGLTVTAEKTDAGTIYRVAA